MPTAKAPLLAVFLLGIFGSLHMHWIARRCFSTWMPGYYGQPTLPLLEPRDAAAQYMGRIESPFFYLFGRAVWVNPVERFPK
jgi:hypothetical protein